MKANLFFEKKHTLHFKSLKFRKKYTIQRIFNLNITGHLVLKILDLCKIKECVLHT